MTRDEAYKLLIEMVQNVNLRKHGLAVEAIMGALCKYLKTHSSLQGVPPSGLSSSSPSLRVEDLRVEDLEPEEEEFNEEVWAIVGLLHDADYELVEKDPDRHTLVTEEKLRPLGVSERIINGIKAHHDGIKESRENLMERSVYAADELSGLITAAALVRPDKKLASLTVESVLKRFKEKSFAAGANREQILACEKELNIPLEEFVAIALKAMQGISSELGL